MRVLDQPQVAAHHRPARRGRARDLGAMALEHSAARAARALPAAVGAALGAAGRLRRARRRHRDRDASRIEDRSAWRSTRDRPSRRLCLGGPLRRRLDDVPLSLQAVPQAARVRPLSLGVPLRDRRARLQGLRRLRRALLEGGGDPWLAPRAKNAEPVLKIVKQKPIAEPVAPGVFVLRNVGGYNVLVAVARPLLRDRRRSGELRRQSAHPGQAAPAPPREGRPGPRGGGASRQTPLLGHSHASSRRSHRRRRDAAPLLSRREAVVAPRDPRARRAAGRHRPCPGRRRDAAHARRRGRADGDLHRHGSPARRRDAPGLLPGPPHHLRRRPQRLHPGGEAAAPDRRRARARGRQDVRGAHEHVVRALRSRRGRPVNNPDRPASSQPFARFRRSRPPTPRLRAASSSAASASGTSVYASAPATP